ncbi:MAG TPA: lipid-A-disaccharide synthase N-terminal domain-containing protein [Luteimonas sp.]|nr:lipid-A-disaccharide synthase N-terminal domain-containing protein [Luteimonas sp.]HRO26353.1 lipid-A-disaccharide synthase N-terminal domain-containing protein [Luteimonas sp.]HRP73067.1 lipid-A-disaccharide synthase N-terminal domain-containing protein [Luteimonas sp.]
MNETIAILAWTGIALTPWKLIGLAGATMFGARWLVQFAASRRAGRAVVPRSFWIMSLCGSVMTLSYFLFSAKQDAVGVLQNLLPALTAAYSLWLELRPSRAHAMPPESTHTIPR